MLDGAGPTLCFHRIEPPRYVGNRWHLDLEIADRAAETARLRALGATWVREGGNYTVLADPEGNQFCLLEPKA